MVSPFLSCRSTATAAAPAISLGPSSAIRRPWLSIKATLSLSPATHHRCTLVWRPIMSEHSLVVEHGGIVTACSAWPPEAAGIAALGLKRGRLRDVQHTYAKEHRSNGCSGGNIILHEHALLS